MSDTLTDKVDLALNVPKHVDRKKIISWIIWDWGTQPFNTVITTFVFAVYITSSAFGDTNATSQALSVSTTIAGIVIALAAPVLGQTVDRTGRSVTILAWFTWILAAVSAALFFVKPHPSYLWLGLILLGVGSVVFEIAAVNYNSLLDDVAGFSNVGKISGFGWGMGYLGGIIMLLVLYFGFIKPDVGLFGITSANAMDIRFSMVLCAVWMVIFTLPTFLNLHNRPAVNVPVLAKLAELKKRSPRFIWSWFASVVASYCELVATVKRLWKISPNTIYFLIASALFRDGLAGIFAFGAVIAQGTFGFTTADVVVFGAWASILAGIATILFGLLDDALGPKRVILISLWALVAVSLVIFFLHNCGSMVYWICGSIMCLFVGPAQSASRSFLARLIPAGRSGEVFGLYATTGRVVSFLAPMLFGLGIGLGHILTGQANTQYWGILGVVVVLLLGLVMMGKVNEYHHSTAA